MKDKVLMIRTISSAQEYEYGGDELLKYREKHTLTELGYEFAKQYSTKRIEYRVYYRKMHHLFSDIYELNKFLEEQKLSPDFPVDTATTYTLTYKE